MGMECYQVFVRGNPGETLLLCSPLSIRPGRCAATTTCSFTTVALQVQRDWGCVSPPPFPRRLQPSCSLKDSLCRSSADIKCYESRVQSKTITYRLMLSTASLQCNCHYHKWSTWKVVCFWLIRIVICIKVDQLFSQTQSQVTTLKKSIFVQPVYFN